MTRNMNTLPRDDLIRLQVHDIEYRDADNGDGTIGTLSGYAAVFDVDTEINGWEGRFIESIRPGAFAKTLTERGDKVKVLFNHGFDAAGQMPLGKPTRLEEDTRGLFYEVPLPDTSLNRDLVPLLRSGAIDGSSFRFSVVREQITEGEGGALPRRDVLEAKLYELGPVTFPAYEAATAGVRGAQAYQRWTQTPADAGRVEGTPPILAPAPVLTDAERRALRVKANRSLQEATHGSRLVEAGNAAR